MYTLTDFQVGQRVELHPASDWWMRGARFGTVTKVGRKYVHVKLDRYDVVVELRPDRIVEINP